MSHQEAFKLLGQEFTVSDSLIKRLETFTCTLYGAPGIKDINRCRYKLFCAKNGEIESSQLPPCKDTLRKHILRANYQAAVWRRCLEASPLIPSPHGHGWKITSTECDDMDIEIDWMDGLPAPLAVLELLSCKCKKACGKDCPCVTNKLSCTDMCKLQNCDNYHSDDDDKDEDELGLQMDFTEDVYSDEDDEDDCIEADEFIDDLPDMECPDPQEEIDIETTLPLLFGEAASDLDMSLTGTALGQ